MSSGSCKAHPELVCDQSWPNVPEGGVDARPTEHDAPANATATVDASRPRSDAGMIDAPDASRPTGERPEGSIDPGDSNDEPPPETDDKPNATTPPRRAGEAPGCAAGSSSSPGTPAGLALLAATLLGARRRQAVDTTRAA